METGLSASRNVRQDSNSGRPADSRMSSEHDPRSDTASPRRVAHSRSDSEYNIATAEHGGAIRQKEQPGAGDTGYRSRQNNGKRVSIGGPPAMSLFPSAGTETSTADNEHVSHPLEVFPPVAHSPLVRRSEPEGYYGLSAMFFKKPDNVSATAASSSSSRDSAASHNPYNDSATSGIPHNSDSSAAVTRDTPLATSAVSGNSMASTTIAAPTSSIATHSRHQIARTFSPSQDRPVHPSETAHGPSRVPASRHQHQHQQHDRHHHHRDHHRDRHHHAHPTDADRGPVSFSPSQDRPVHTSETIHGATTTHTQQSSLSHIPGSFPDESNPGHFATIAAGSAKIGNGLSAGLHMPSFLESVKSAWMGSTASPQPSNAAASKSNDILNLNTSTSELGESSSPTSIGASHVTPLASDVSQVQQLGRTAPETQKDATLGDYNHGMTGAPSQQTRPKAHPNAASTSQPALATYRVRPGALSYAKVASSPAALTASAVLGSKAAVRGKQPSVSSTHSTNVSSAALPPTTISSAPAQHSMQEGASSRMKSAAEAAAVAAAVIAGARLGAGVVSGDNSSSGSTPSHSTNLFATKSTMPGGQQSKKTGSETPEMHLDDIFGGAESGQHTMEGQGAVSSMSSSHLAQAERSDTKLHAGSTPPPSSMSAVPDSQWAKHSDTTTADMHSDKVLGGTNDGPNAMQSKQDASPRKSSISAAADAAAAAASVTAGAMLGSKTPSASNQTPATTTQPRKASFSRPMTLSYAKVASMPVTPPAVTPAAIPTTTPSATSATTSSGFDASWAKQGDPSNLHDNAAFSKPRGVVSSNDMAGAVMAAAASAGAKDSSKAKPGSRRSSAPSGAHDTWRDKHSGVAPPEMYMGNVQSNAQDESDSSQTGWKVYRGKRHYTTAATAGASVPQALRHRGTESDMNLGDDLPASQSRQGASADEGKSRAKTASTAAAATAAAATGILLGAKVGSNAHEAKHGDVVTPEMQLDGVSGNTDVGRVPMQPGDGSSLGETLSRGRQAVSAATQPINISSWPTAPTAQQPKRSGMATPEMQLGDVFGNSEDGFMTSPQRQDTSSSTGSSLTWSVPEGVINPTGHRPRTSTPPPVLPGIQRNRKDGTITPEMHLDDVFGNPEEGFASSQPSAHVSSGSQPNKPEDASSATAPTFAGGASVPLVAPTDVPVGFSALSGTDRPLNAPTPPTSVLTTNPTTGYVQEVKKGETPSSSSSKAPPMAGAAAAAGLTAGALLAAKAASGSEQPSSTSFQKSNDISSTPTVPGVQGARQDGAATPEMQLGDIFGDRDEGLADSANTLYADRSGPTPVVIPLSGFHLPQTVSRQPIAALSLPSDPPITADVGRDNSSDSHQHPYARDEADNVPVGVSGLTDGGRVGGAGEGSPGMVSGASFGSTWPSAGIPQAAGLREGSGGIGAASSKVPDVEQGQIKMNGPNGQAKPTQVKTRIFPDGHDDDHIPIDEDKLELDLSLVPEEEEESRHGTPLDATSSASAHPNGPAGDLDTPSAAKMGAGIAALSVPVGIAAAKHAFDSSSPIGKSEVTDPSDMTTANQAQYPDTGVTASTVSPFGVSAALGSTETDIKHPTTGAAEGSTDASALSHPSATILAPSAAAGLLAALSSSAKPGGSNALPLSTSNNADISAMSVTGLTDRLATGADTALPLQASKGSGVAGLTGINTKLPPVDLGAPVTASPTIENLNDVLSKRAVNPLPNRMEELAPAQHTAVMLHPSSKDEMALEGEEMGDVHAGLDAGLDADVNVDANADADAIADINADADIDAGVDANAVAAEGATEGAADTTASGVKVRRSATAKIAAGAAAGAVAAAAAAKKMSEPIAHAAKKVTEPIANAAKKVPPLPDSIAKGPSAEAVALARHPSLSAEARKGLEPPTVDLSKAEFPTLVIKSPHKDVDYANAPRPLLQQDLKAELDNETVDYTNVARPQLQQDQKEFLNNEQVNFASMPRPQLQQLPKDAIKDDRVDFSKYPHPVLMSTESPHKPVDYNRLPPPVMPEHQKIAQQSDQDLHVKVANAPRPVIDYETVKAQKEELRRNKSVKKENERYAKELAAATALVHKHSRTTAVPAPPTATTIKGEPIEPRNEQDREVFAAAAAITAEQNALKAQKKAEKRERRKDIGKGFFGSLAIFGIGKKLRNRRQADQTPGVVATTVASTAATTAAMISAKSVGKQLASEQAQATTIPSSATDEHAPPATTTASKEEVAKPTVDSAALAPVVASTALVPAVASVGLAQADFNDQEEEGSSSGQAQREAEEQAQREAEEQAAQIAAEKAKRAAEGKALEEAAEMALKEADDKHRREEEEALQAKAREDMLLKARLEREAMERGIRLRMEQEAREAEERLRKEREQQAAAQQVQAMALQRAQFQTPPGYHGPIPNIAAGERLMWIRKVVTTQYFDTDEDYRYYLSSAGGRVDNKIENRTTPNTAVNRGSGFGH